MGNKNTIKTKPLPEYLKVKCKTVFEMMDKDHGGTIDRKEA